MGSLLVGTGSASAVLVGFVAGIALAWSPTPPIGWLAALGVAAILADLFHVRTGRPSPLSVGRQVPVEWGRMFDPRVVAILYGPRLGVGPLTMLSTWMWWAATIGAALVGVFESVVVAAVFGVVRLLVTVGASQQADRAGHAIWFTRLRSGTTRAWLSLDGVAVALLVVVALTAAACTSSTNVEAGPDALGGASTTPSATSQGAEEMSDQESSDNATDPTDAESSTPTTEILTESSLSATSTPLVTSPDDIEPRPPAGADALASVLVDEIPGFEAITGPSADRELSIDEAARLQPDPTEELPLLETRGYQGGWTRAFRNDDNDVIVTTVYDFVSALEADFYLEDGTITLIGDGSTIYEVGSIPEARGFTQRLDDSGASLVVYGITFTSRNKWFLVTIVGDPGTATPERLLPAAAAQYESAVAETATD